MKSRFLVCAGAAMALSGCISFVPTYDDALYKHLDAVSSDVDKIHTAISVVHSGPTEFSVVEAYYVDAFSNLAAAKQIATDRTTYSAHKLAEKPAADELQAIKNCEAALTQIMARHKSAPMTAATEALFADQGVCGVPATMEALLKKAN